MNGFVRFETAIALAILLATLAACGGPPQDARPNIIVVLTDDQGYGDVGIHGNDKIRTPNLDQFARDGIEMTRFYVSPVCAPTRASLMTGRYYYRSGVVHTSRGGAKMHGDEVTIAERLGAAGYRTGIFGKWHLGDNYPMRPMEQGFDESLVHKAGGIDQNPNPDTNNYFDDVVLRNGKETAPEGYCTDVFFDAALDFIAAKDDRPFFVYLPTNAPHTPLFVADDYWKPYADEGLDETTARVYGMVENIDDNMGRLLAALEASGQRDNTLVVFMSDNGPQQTRYTAGLRGRKAMSYEGGIRALSFWQWPSKWESPRQESRIAGHIDVAPTLLAAAGVAESGPAFDGTNLLPLLDGSGDWPDRKLFFQCHRGLTPMLYQNAAVETERYKLVMSPETFNDEAFAYDGDPVMALYDIVADPGEQQDLSSEQPEVLADLRSSYEAWYEDVRSTRNFTPGVIHLGVEAENPALLSRYQDSTYVDGKPTTWSVDIERAGRYRFHVRAERTPAEEMHLVVNGAETVRELGAGSTEAEFELPAGPAGIDIRVQAAGEPRQLTIENTREGNVTVEYLGPL